MLEDDDHAGQVLEASGHEAPLDLFGQMFTACENRRCQVAVVEGEGVFWRLFDHDVRGCRAALVHDRTDVARQLDAVATEDERDHIVFCRPDTGGFEKRLHALAACDEREAFPPAWGRGRLYLHVNLILLLDCAYRSFRRLGRLFTKSFERIGENGESVKI